MSTSNVPIKASATTKLDVVHVFIVFDQVMEEEIKVRLRIVVINMRKFWRWKVMTVVQVLRALMRNS